MATTDAQTSLRMSEDLHQRLSSAAKNAGHSLGEEIRLRLEASFKPARAAEVQMDEKTRALVTAIANMTMIIAGFYEPWHTDRFAFEIIKAAVNTALDYDRPQGEPIFRFNRDKHLIDAISPSDQPEVIGRIVAMTELSGRARGKRP